MRSKHSFLLWEYISYLLRAVNAHALHSPFLFDLYNQTIIPSKKQRIAEFESLRQELMKQHDQLGVLDLKSGTSSELTIQRIAKSSLSHPRFSMFLFLLVKFLGCRRVMETGTSFGINSLYLSRAADQVTTVEASDAIALIASTNFQKAGVENIRLVQGDLHQVLEKEIREDQPDFYFLDADHRSFAVSYCVDQIMKHTPAARCIVIHDIYWSKDMLQVWKKLRKDQRFTLTLDIYQAGLLFPVLSMPKQDFTLHF